MSPRLPPEATYSRKAHLLQPDRKSGFFLQLTWLIEGEAGLFRSEIWQAKEAGNPEENESIRQWLLPALATSCAWVGGGSRLSIWDQPHSLRVWESPLGLCAKHRYVCKLWMAWRFLKLRGGKENAHLLLEEARNKASSPHWFLRLWGRDLFPSPYPMGAVHLPWIKIWIFDVVPGQLKEKKYNLQLLAKFKVNHDTYPFGDLPGDILP